MSYDSFRELSYLRNNFEIIEKEYNFLIFNFEKDKKLFEIIELCENFKKFDNELKTKEQKEIFDDFIHLSESGYIEVYNREGEYAENLKTVFGNFFTLLKI